MVSIGEEVKKNEHLLILFTFYPFFLSYLEKTS